MRVYISGPITGTTDYLERFDRMEALLRQQGFSVINPARVNAMMPKDLTHEEYMAMSLTMLELADMVYFLRGWQKSKGCQTEWDAAVAQGHCIMYEVTRSEQK